MRFAPIADSVRPGTASALWTLARRSVCFCARLAVRLRGTFDRQLTVVPGPLEALVHEGISAVRVCQQYGPPGAGW